MLKSTLLVVAVLAVAALGSPLPRVSPLVEYGNANFYIDLVLYNVNTHLPKEPLYIGDIGGPFNMHNCYFLGLEWGIKREGDATLSVTGNQAKFVMGLQMKDTGLVCDWKYLLYNGGVTAITPHVSIASGLFFLMAHGQHPYLTQFEVTSMDPIVVDISGVPGLNWLIEDIADWVLLGAQDEITYIIETTVRTIFQDILDTMVLP